MADQWNSPFRYLHCWEETECLNYYSLLSLHEVYDIVGSQLTETDIEVLSFLLNKTSSLPHLLDPAGWTVEPSEDDPNDLGVSPSAQLMGVWRRLNAHVRVSPQPLFASHKPRSGLELLLELERRGYISEGNLEPLLQLLRVLTRHDLLPYVSHKKRRTVSPERVRHWHGAEHKGPSCSLGQSCRTAETPLSSLSHQWRSGFYSPMPVPPAPKRRRRRGNGWSRKPKKSNKQNLLPPPPPPPKMSCEIRLRVRAEYLEHESALRNSVSSDKREPLERQFELFSQASSLLRSRSLGSIVCDIKFTELANLDAFWTDYLSGALLEALKGVFLTESLRSAAGSEGVRLLISVDQDDYEHGRRLLRGNTVSPPHSHSCSHSHWTL